MRTYRKNITTGRPMTLLWADSNGTAIDFSTGYTFLAYIVDRVVPGTLLATKTTGITGSSGTLGYNLLIDWASSDFTALTAGAQYAVTVVATPTVGDPFAFPGTAEFYLEAEPTLSASPAPVAAATFALSASGSADQVQINTAITACTALGGGTVWLKAGVYDITAPVTLKDNVTLCGEGDGTILRLHDHGDCRVVTNYDLAAGNTNIRLKDLQIDGYGAHQTIVPINDGTGTDAVYFIFSTNIEVSGCYIHDGNRHNLFISDSCSAVRITKNRLKSSLGLTNMAFYNSNDITVTGNTSSNSNETGIKCDTCHTVAIAGNNFFNATTIGVYLTGGSSTTVTGNAIRGGQQGIRIVSQDYCTVTGNTIRDATQHGIAFLQNCNVHAVIGNIIRNIGSGTANTYDGVNIDDTGAACDNIVISGNTITDVNSKMRYGIRSLSNSGVVTLGPNIISGHVTGDVLLAGSTNRTGTFSAVLSPGTIGTVNDAATFLFATNYAIGASSNAALAKYFVPRACTLKAAYCLFHNSGTLASSETSTISIRVNNTTDTTISAAVVNDAVATEFNNAAMSVSLAAGDYLAVKWVAPTWVTNPSNVRPAVTLHFE